MRAYLSKLAIEIEFPICAYKVIVNVDTLIFLPDLMELDGKSFCKTVSLLRLVASRHVKFFQMFKICDL